MTSFHNDQELAQIAAIPCPEHGVRDTGFGIYLAAWMPQDPEFLHLCKCPPHPAWDKKLKSPRYTEFPKPVIESPYQPIENPQEFLRNHELKLKEQRERRRKEEIERLMPPPNFDK